jgi:hypothetical protein
MSPLSILECGPRVAARIAVPDGAARFIIGCSTGGAMNGRVNIHSHSLTLDEALKKLRRQPSSQLRFLSVASDKLYAAVAWKRLFLIALKRLARHQPQLARLTAIEALTVLAKSLLRVQRNCRGQRPLNYVKLSPSSETLIGGHCVEPPPLV